MCEPLESRQLLSTGSPVATLAASADSEPVVTIRTTQNAKESADPSKGNGIFTIQRTGPTSAPLAVQYTVNTSAPDSATPGVDYVALTGGAIIPAHKSSVQVRVQAFLDAVPEGRETVTVDLATDPSYAIDASHPSAQMGITNVFAIDTVTAFGDLPNTYTSTAHTTYKTNPQPKIITTADATFPLDLLGFGAAAPVGEDFLVMNGTQGSSGVFLDNMQLIQKGDSPENDLTLRIAQTRGAAEKGGVEQSALFIPPIVGPSSTLKLYSQLSVNGSSETVPGTVQITTKATANVKVKTPEGTFTTTKLLVTTIISGHGHVVVTARHTRNGPEITRNIYASVNDQITWTYYLVPGTGRGESRRDGIVHPDHIVFADVPRQLRGSPALARALARAGAFAHRARYRVVRGFLLHRQSDHAVEVRGPFCQPVAQASISWVLLPRWQGHRIWPIRGTCRPRP